MIKMQNSKKKLEMKFIYSKKNACFYQRLWKQVMMMTTTKYDTYSPEQKIGVEILKCNNSGEAIYFSKLVDKFKGEISRNTINKVLDKLTDLCMIYADWEEINNHKWVRSLRISEGEYKMYFKLLSDNKDDSPLENKN